MLGGWNKGQGARRHWTCMKTYTKTVYKHKNRALKPHKCKWDQIIVEKKAAFLLLLLGKSTVVPLLNDTQCPYIFLFKFWR